MDKSVDIAGRIRMLSCCSPRSEFQHNIVNIANQAHRVESAL
jgi:hypothetical protein